jgi:hypothetical protein
MLGAEADARIGANADRVRKARAAQFTHHVGVLTDSRPCAQARK